MKKQSAGILLFRFKDNALEVLLVHPGGPFYKKRDAGAWSIPKGLVDENQNALEAAKREFKEETGMAIEGDFLPLKPLKQKSGKVIFAWALKGDFDTKQFISNTFELEWPPKSARIQRYPEMDKARWFGIKEATEKIQHGQLGFIDELVNKRIEV